MFARTSLANFRRPAAMPRKQLRPVLRRGGIRLGLRRPLALRNQLRIVEIRPKPAPRAIARVQVLPLLERARLVAAAALGLGGVLRAVAPRPRRLPPRAARRLPSAPGGGAGCRATLWLRLG